MSELKTELGNMLNRRCRDNESNTPDHILAEFMLAALEAFEAATKARETWYGGKLIPARGGSPWITPDENGEYHDPTLSLD